LTYLGIKSIKVKINGKTKTLREGCLAKVIIDKYTTTKRKRFNIYVLKGIGDSKFIKGKRAYGYQIINRWGQKEWRACKIGYGKISYYTLGAFKPIKKLKVSVLEVRTL